MILLFSVQRECSSVWTNNSFASPCDYSGSVQGGTHSQIPKFMGPTWGPPGSCRLQLGSMLAQYTLLPGFTLNHWHTESVRTPWRSPSQQIMLLSIWEKSTHLCIWSNADILTFYWNGFWKCSAACRWQLWSSGICDSGLSLNRYLQAHPGDTGKCPSKLTAYVSIVPT